MPHSIAQGLGWLGMFLLVVAYAKRSSLPRRRYAGFNLAGAVCLGVSCYAAAAWPPFAMQCVWGAIALRDLGTARR
jgi:hypothetical protein